VLVVLMIQPLLLSPSLCHAIASLHAHGSAFARSSAILQLLKQTTKQTTGSVLAVDEQEGAQAPTRKTTFIIR
jgi:hypothetical protein